MRIAFVSSQAQLTSAETFASGPANYLLRVSRSLQEHGHEVVLFTVGDRDEQAEVDGMEVVTVGIKKPSRLQRFAAGTLHVHAYYSKLLNRRVRTYHRGQSIDVIQYTNYRATALHRPPEIPAVMRISSYRPLWDDSHVTGGKTRSRRQARRLELEAFRCVDLIYGPSRLLADAVSKDTGIDVEVIEPPFFLETTQTDCSVLREEIDGRHFFLYVGSMTERKGVPVLAKAAATLLRRHPEHLLVLAGRDKPYGASSMVERLRETVGEGAEDAVGRVRYLGELPHAKLYPLYPAADAVLLPSLMDNLPNSCLEAMAAGSVVVGTDGASFEQLIEHGRSGFLAERGNAESLTAAAEAALALSGPQRSAVQVAAQERMQELSPEKQIPKLVSLYHRAIEAGRGG